MVFGLCRLLLRDGLEAEDATQQVFLAAHRSVSNGLAPRDPGSWLAAIARNECRARLRSRSRVAELPLLPEHLPDPVAEAVQAADLDALWRALAELPRRQRKAFLLRELGGLSYRELGEALGMTQPAVESLLFRARRRLRNLLTAASAAAVPTPLRDQLARLLPAFGPSSPATATVKCAAVAVGLGLGATGLAELPRQHSRPHLVRSRVVVETRRIAHPTREVPAAPPARVVEEPVAFVTHRERSPNRGHAGPRAEPATEPAHAVERRGRGPRDQHPEPDPPPQPSQGDDAPAGAPAQAVQPEPDAERQEQAEHHEQTTALQEAGPSAPAVSHDGSGDVTSRSGEGKSTSSDGGGSGESDGGK